VRLNGALIAGRRRPSRASVYERLGHALPELDDRFGGLPSTKGPSRFGPRPLEDLPPDDWPASGLRAIDNHEEINSWKPAKQTH